jgi:hypothetical protein
MNPYRTSAEPKQTPTLMCRLGVHDWVVTSSYDASVPFNYIRRAEHIRCQRCGRERVRFIDG